MGDALNKMLEGVKNNEMKRVIFPEACEPEIIRAAHRASVEGICEPVFLGVAEDVSAAVRALGLDDSFYTFLSTDDEELRQTCVQATKDAGSVFSAKRLARLAAFPLNLGAMCLNAGLADAMVSGLTYATAEVVLAATGIVGLVEGVSSPSSMFILDVPGFEGSEGGMIALSDGGLCENPNEAELADIAVITARTVRKLLGWEPRVAMLSYSTSGSSLSDMTKKVIAATKLAQEKDPNILVDGEMQLDAAIVPAVAQKKMGRESAVAGQANVLIVPDLNVGNILYKAIQRFAGADAYGPIMQGFRKPVNDLSRGSSADDIFGVIVASCLMAND